MLFKYMSYVKCEIMRQRIKFTDLSQQSLGLCISRPSALYLAPDPGHGPQFVFTGPVPQFAFTGHGPQFVSPSPGTQLVFTKPDRNFAFTGTSP